MGFSLISAAEILYHCFMGLFRGSNKDIITENADFDLWQKKEEDSDENEDFTDDEAEQNHVSDNIKTCDRERESSQVSFLLKLLLNL